MGSVHDKKLGFIVNPRPKHTASMQVTTIMCCSVLGQRHRGYNLGFRVGGYVIEVHQ